ncbi:H-NS family nucleoid-associated regulatory protein [Paraburkholderia flagellata]|uniref:H-NS family nucleoid-associated regulatory protein n=1 Tax=Paraburkholderia flagellata TaxID=2883241 RepID=UPI001F404AA7|nr:H-NS family nucleoid-associated regulatory protein [Paraburkholderia flagellata]
MAELGIEPDDAAASIAADQAKMRAAHYRDAFGNNWDGEGNTPQWVVQATSAGQSLEHFAISRQPEPASRKRPNIDWGNDPFAGTRLATIKPERIGAA